MKGKVFLLTAAVVLTGLCVFIASAGAVTWNPGCVALAKEAKVKCTDVCKEEFQVLKDECRNVDHSCAELCRATYDSCVTDPLDQLTDCKAVCQSEIVVAKDNCRIAFPSPSDSKLLDACIDQAQVVAFQCRDDCREAVNPALTACRVAFRACIVACPAP